MLPYSLQREQMVEQQIVARGVRDEHVLAAMRAVPREQFVANRYRALAHGDTPLPIEVGQTISQPYIVALMIEAAEVGLGDRVLEVGAGSGYAAAVMSRIAADVFAVERHEVLATAAAARMTHLGYDNVIIARGDGTRGWPEHAPFNVIVVSAGGSQDIPPHLLDQLKIGGRLVIPVGTSSRSQELVRLRRMARDQYERTSFGAVQFVPLVS